MAKKVDLILLHPPRVYDFRKLDILYGPDSDIIFSSPIYEMYPIGFMTISEYLARHGYKVRIINLAVKMLSDKKFDVEKLIKSLNPNAFGIDLHWLPHAQGSLEIAKICKKYHPEIPTIFGGLSASYFHKELITYPQVDYVIRGDSAEEPLRQLISAIRKKGSPEDIPNLTWKDNGTVQINPLTYVPENLNNLGFDYRAMMGASFTFSDLSGYRPFPHWFSYPTTGVFTCRGCLNNCLTCGGSKKAFKSICNRDLPAYRSPELVAEDIFQTAKYIRAPIMLVGDTWQTGKEYANQLINFLEKRKIDNHLMIEFFQPPEKEFLERLTRAIPNLNLEISPESHDETVRYAFGRNYSNQVLEDFIENALNFGSQRIDLFFMTGLPKQSKESIAGTVEYCKYLLERFGFKKRLHPYIAPLAPFVDPGSIAFENPEACGYKLFYKSLEEHRQALLKPTWKLTLNYETIWMNREEIVSSTLENELRLDQLKQKYGLLEKKFVQWREKRIKDTLFLMEKIDTQEKVVDYLPEIKRLNQDLVYPKKEIELPKKLIHFNLPRVIGTFFAPVLSGRTNPAIQTNREMRLTEHLEELRSRIITGVIIIVFACLISFILCYSYRKEILSMLIKPVGKLYFLSPTEAFMSYMKISLVLGLFLALPVVLYQIWAFVGPGLREKEKKFVLYLIPAVFLLFISGIAFAYFVLIPTGIKFLLSLATPDLMPMITVDRYLSFILTLMLACGMVFQLPVLSFFLTKLGIISAKMLIRNWKYIILLIFIISALVTPTPDVFNQIILAIPMFFLYGISIWVSWLARKKE